MKRARRSALLSACAVLALGCALLYPPAASAGFNSPLHWSSPTYHLKDALNPIDRCPKLSNPIECGALDLPSSGHAGHGHQDRRDRDKDGADFARMRAPRDGHYASDAFRAWRHPNRVQCDVWRVAYEVQHFDGKPRSLAGFYGCELWGMDAYYHSRFPHAPRIGLDPREPGS